MCWQPCENRKFIFDTSEIYKNSQTVEDKQKVQEILNSVYSLMDKGTKKNIFHKNTAARKKSKLADSLKTA